MALWPAQTPSQWVDGVCTEKSASGDSEDLVRNDRTGDPVTVEGEDEQKKVHSLLSLVPHTTRRSARRTLAWRAHSVPVGCAGRFHNRLQTRLAPKKRIERRPRLRTPGLTTPRAWETYQRPRIAKLIPPCCTHPRWILRGKTRIDPIAMTRLNAAQARPY